jgi:hypothetical protein
MNAMELNEAFAELDGRCVPVPRVLRIDRDVVNWWRVPALCILVIGIAGLALLCVTLSRL